MLKNKEFTPDWPAHQRRIQSIRESIESGPCWQGRFSILGHFHAEVVWNKEICGELMTVKILVVDDSAPARDGLRLLLEQHVDWEVCGEAADGIEAIEKYQQLMPDLLVIDVSMPRMNGLDAAREILKRSPRSLILLYTSYLTAQLIEAAHKAGIRGTVSKDAMQLVVIGLEALLRGDEFSGPAN